MKNSFKKSALIFLTAICVSSGAVALAACNGGAGGDEVSGLIGRFTSASDTEVILSNDESLAGTYDGENRPYIYTSGLYPLNTIERESVVYSVSQTLRLKRDYTYEYSYGIQLKKVTQDGNTELTKMDVSLKGVFSYTAEDRENFYQVSLSTPVSGEELRYGAAIADERNIYSWRQSASANYRIDVSLLSENDADRYVSGRSVRVERGEERVLYDDIFYCDFLTDIAPFCTYLPQGSESPEKPDEPANPENPEEISTGITLPVKMNGKTGVRVVADSVPSIRIITEGKVPSVRVNGTEITEKHTENGLNIFVAPVIYADFGTDIAVVSGGDIFEFNPAEYLKSLITTENQAALEQKSLAALCVSLLNIAEKSGADISLTAAESALVYESLGNNKYHSDWGLRDNLTVTGGGVEGFGWDGVPSLLTDGGVRLEYKFFVNSGDYLNLKAKFTTGGIEFVAEVVSVGTEDGKTYYKAETANIAPIEFDSAVRCEIFDGENKISGVAEYSVTRACAKSDLDESEKTKDMSKAIYSLGKSAAWYGARKNATYSYLPPVNGGGRYELKIGSYTYNDERMSVPAQTFTGSGSSLYMSGTLTNDGKKENLGSGFTANKTQVGFFVTLGGASVDGIRISGGASDKLTLSLKGTSQINNVILSAFGDASPSASLKSHSDLIITGENGAVLNVFGNIYAGGNLIIENVTVNVYGCLDVSAVACASLNINGGALNVVNNSGATVAASGIRCGGSISLNGNLRSDGYATGIELCGAVADGLTVNGGGLKINAQNYGISGSDPKTANRELVFNGGESSVSAGNGIRYGNVTLGNAKLTVTAKGGANNAGYAIEAVYPVTIRTESGDSRSGNLNLINKNTESFFDVNYTVKVDKMLLNGGSVYIYGLNPNGVVHTVQGSEISVENCDLTIENGQNLSAGGYGRAISAQNGDERISVANSAKAVFRNCDAAIACWGKAGGENFARLENDGLIILDTYKVGLAQWELDSWNLVLTVVNRGQIRTINHIGS